ncbi:MAG TPA: sugar phosphate isomerase/epimerase family protein [Syntrophobacteraceae bacterium]|nr:sugar phosphate isomerase/epimerase family protein [Syntrophobacteraceae bacterium]
MPPEPEEKLQSLLRSVHVNIPWRELPKYVDTILHLRLNVEIGIEATVLDELSRPEIVAVVSQLRREGCRITLHGPFWDLSPGSVDPLIRRASRRRLQQFFDVVDSFRPIQVVCHTGFDPRHHGGHRSLWLDESLTVWEILVRRGEDLQVPLLLENVWEYGPDLHKELFGRIPSPYFGFCLDVGHQHSFSRTPLTAWLDELQDRLREVHLHDNDGSGDAHLPIGDGTIDFVGLFRFLGSRGMKPVLTLEPHREEHLAGTLRGLNRMLSAAGWNSFREGS